MEAFIFFLLGIVASIIVNLATPYMQKKLEGTILVNRGKRLKALNEELVLLRELYKNSSKFMAAVTSDIIFLISLLTFIIFLGIVTSFIQTVAVQMPTFSAYRFLGYVASTRQALRELSIIFHQVAWLFLYITVLSLGIFATFVIRISNKIKKVKDFELYEREVEKRIRDLTPTSNDAPIRR